MTHPLIRALGWCLAAGIILALFVALLSLVPLWGWPG